MSLWNVFLIPGTYVEEVLLMPFQDEVLNVYNGPPEKTELCWRASTNNMIFPNSSVCECNGICVCV